MVEISQVEGPESRFVGGTYSGEGGSHLDVCEVCSGETTFDNNLRWVPPGFWETIFGKPCQGRVITQLIVATTGTLKVYGFVALFLKFSPRFQRLLSNKVWRGCINNVLRPNSSACINLSSAAIVPLSVISVKLKADDAGFDLGSCEGNGARYSWFPVAYCYIMQWKSDRRIGVQIAGSVGREYVGQRISEKKMLIAGDCEVSSFPNTHEISLRVGSVLRGQQASGTDFVGGYTSLGIFNYIDLLNPDVVRFNFHYNESRHHYRVIRECFRLRNIALVVIGLLRMVRNGVRTKRKGMANLSTIFMAANLFAKKRCDWLEESVFWLMVYVLRIRKSKAWQYDDKGGIISLGLFNGTVHTVLRGLDLCLFSVFGHTVLILATHKLVQCLWKHCSNLGWSSDSTIYFLDKYAFLTIALIGALLEFLPSRILVRNHYVIWILLEAYLAAVWFVKASLDCSYLFIRVHRAPSQTKAFFSVGVRVYSCCSVNLLFACFFCCLYRFEYCVFPLVWLFGLDFVSVCIFVLIAI